MSLSPPYATVAELRSFIADGTTESGSELALAVETASRSVDRATNRQFGLADEPQTRFYTPTFDSVSPFGLQHRWTVAIDDLMDNTALAVELDGVPVTGYTPVPVNAVLDGKPWTKLLLPRGLSVPTGAQIAVTATFGWTAIPDAIKLATMIQASRLFARRHAPFGILGSPETGGELRLLERLDADLMTSVRPYVRMWGAV